VSTLLEALLYATHAWVFAIYYGGLTFWYFWVAPRTREVVGSGEQHEALALGIAHGLRWWVFGAFALAGATGAMLAGLTRLPARSPVWWALIVAKAAVLALTVAVYAYGSYVMWPRRVFASPDERPAEHRRFFRVGLLLGALMVCELVLGALLHVMSRARP
jgi:hypothetical protein